MAAIAVASTVTGVVSPSMFNSAAVVATAATIKTDARYVIVAKNSGKAISVVAGSMAEGAPVRQWTRLDLPQQQWTFAPLAGSFYRITNVHSGKVLDVATGPAVGAIARQATSTGALSQQWKVSDAADSTVILTNRGSGLVVDIYRIFTGNGVTVQQWPANRGTNQRFTLYQLADPTTTPTPSATGTTSPPGTPAPTPTPAPSPTPTTGSGGGGGGNGAFVHPGIDFNQADLAELKSNLTAEPYRSVFAGLATDRQASPAYVMRGPYVDVLPDSPTQNAYQSDMQAAYDLALRGYLSGNALYSAKARYILLAWARTQKAMGPWLIAGDYMNRSVAAADLLRGTYAGWATADTAVFKTYLAAVFWPLPYLGHDILGAGTHLRSANQGANQLRTAMAVAVFLDDRSKFNQVINAYLTDPAGGIRDSLPNGELGDSGRDQGHAYAELFGLAFVADIAWKQGVDLFSAENNRLLAASEYFARYNLGENPPFMQFGTSYNLFTSIGGARWMTHENNALDIIHTAYVVRLGLKAPYTDLMRAKVAENITSIAFRREVDHSHATSPATPWSGPASTDPVTTLTSADLGAVQAPGSTAYANGTWALAGAGKGQETGYHYAYRAVTGDVTLTARVANRGAATAVTGLMMRQTVNATGANYFALRLFGTGGEQAFWRSGVGILSGTFQNHTSAMGAYWLRITRRGNYIYSYNSFDGVHWSPSANVIFAALPATMYIGLYTASGNPQTLNTATFDHVSIGTAATTLAPAPANATATRGYGRVTLRWATDPRDVYYTVQRSAGGGPYSTIATDLTSPGYTDWSAVAGTAYSYRIASAGFGGLSAATQVTPAG